MGEFAPNSPILPNLLPGSILWRTILEKDTSLWVGRWNFGCRWLRILTRHSREFPPRA